MRRTRLAAAIAVAAATVLGVPAVADAAPKPKADIPVQLVAMNDFHGRISNTAGGDSQLLTSPGPDRVYGRLDENKHNDDTYIEVGGSANVASTVKRVQADFRRSAGSKAASYFVGAGDLISASPFESSVFKDEPTIEVLNAMGLNASSVGNHEFDRGTRELRRISAATDGTFTDNVTACQGVQRDVTGCFTDSTGHAFRGAQFPYLAANVVSKRTGQPMLPPYQIFDAGQGRKVALIGVVTDTTPTIVSPDGVADVKFIDEAEAVNRWTHELKKQGISAIGVLVHEGGSVTVGKDSAHYTNSCDNLTGPIVDLNNRIDKQVDFIVSAHTHQMYNCLLPVRGSQPRLVTQAGFYGRLVTDIRLSLDPQTGDVDRQASYRAANVNVTRENPDTTVAAIVKYWNDRSAVAGNKVIGHITADIMRASAGGKENRGAESSLGNLVAQAQLEALQQPQFADPTVGLPVIAFMNPGGLRTDLLFDNSKGGEAPGDVTYREAFDVQPFGNTVNAITLTGAAIDQVLEEQFQADGPRATQLVLGTSQGFTYRYDLSKPYGQRVTNIALNGTPIVPTTSYRVVANSFLVGGGDTFNGFTTGTNPVTGPVDVDTAVSYFAAHPSVSPPQADHGTVG